MERKFLFACLAIWAALAVALVPLCVRAADLTISNQVQYHHREVFVSLEAVPLARAIREIYRRALAPRSVSFVGRVPATDDDLVTIQFQGPPWVLADMIRDMLEARGYSMHATQWGSDVIVERDIGRQPQPPPPPSPVTGEPGGGGGVFSGQ